MLIRMYPLARIPPYGPATFLNALQRVLAPVEQQGKARLKVKRFAAFQLQHQVHHPFVRPRQLGGQFLWVRTNWPVCR